MPIVTENNLRKILCINHKDHLENLKDFSSVQTSMVEVGKKHPEGERWYTLTEIRPKNENKEVEFLPASGIPVKVFTCSFCGYCEIYHGQVTSEEIWGK
jgi:hypothetical protein